MPDQDEAEPSEQPPDDEERLQDQDPAAQAPEGEDLFAEHREKWYSVGGGEPYSLFRLDPSGTRPVERARPAAHEA